MAWRIARFLCLATWLAASAGLDAASAAGIAKAAPAADNMVDVQLVLAVDVSYSMDPDEQALQREGYAAALVSDEFLNALRQGPRGRIAATYVEWAGEREQKVVLDWRIIDSPASARAFSDAIRAAPLRRVYRTSISSALLFSANHLKTSGYRGLRNVIDVSGDGVNNQGPPVEQVRDEVVAQGITINGLPLLLKRSANSAIDIPDLDVYYEDCVIGGAGAFVIPVREQAEFARAIRTKLVLEVAGLQPPEVARLIPAASPPRMSCLIGERLWREHWNN